MTVKTITCRTHGGVFKVQARPGRPPVKCTEDNQCSRADQADTVSAPKRRGARADNFGAQVVADTERANASESVVEPPTADNPSLPLAMDTKAQLEALGWSAAGKAQGTSAQITATRGAETLIMVWHDGELKAQDYSLAYVKPSDNGIPPHSLGFDPDELTNAELVQTLRGMKVTWWNTLANSTETAVVGNKVSIEHIYHEHDREKRIVKFIDHSGGGFRAFHVTALLKIG